MRDYTETTSERNDRIERTAKKETDWRDAVLDRLNEGDTFMAIKDTYNYISPQKGVQREPITSKRTVKKFYPHYVLTEDEWGRPETYQYFDLYQILNKGGLNDGIII